MTNTVLILGPSGKIGTHAARAFEQAGWKIRSYDRNTDMTAAAKGVDVIVNGLNPPNYHNWATLIPKITAQVIAAAKASGATVIIPGNVYNYGATPGIWSETTPQNATSRKGRIRMDMEKAYRQSGVKTIVLRAGNFIDPDQNGDILSMLMTAKLAKGKLVTMGATDVAQVFCYLPDWARAVVQLVEKRTELDDFEDIPFPGHNFTMEQMRVAYGAMLNRDIRFSRFPWWIMTIAQPFWELARELTEMRYLWNTDHRLSGEKIDRLLPDFESTNMGTVLSAGLVGDIHPNKAVPGSLGLSSV